jgi:heme exporter protein D
MTEFFAMGGYAWYVWMSYGAVAVAILVEVLAVRARRKRAMNELRMSSERQVGSPSMLGARGNR